MNMLENLPLHTARLKLLQFPDVIEARRRAVSKLSTEAILGDLHLHHLTDYLWEHLAVQALAIFK